MTFLIFFSFTWISCTLLVSQTDIEGSNTLVELARLFLRLLTIFLKNLAAISLVYLIFNGTPVRKIHQENVKKKLEG